MLHLIIIVQKHTYACARLAPDLQVKTAPYDHRFPSFNQARHCFTRYNEFYKYAFGRLYHAAVCASSLYASLMSLIQSWLLVHLHLLLLSPHVRQTHVRCMHALQLNVNCVGG